MIAQLPVQFKNGLSLVFSLWQRSWVEICWRTWCHQKVWQWWFHYVWTCQQHTSSSHASWMFPHLFPPQCSRLSYDCLLHPATTTTYTTWMRQKACATSSTSPFSTSDLGDGRRQSGKLFPSQANLPSFSPRSPPSPHWRWRWEEVQRSPCDPDERSRTPLALTRWARTELSQTVARCTALWRNTGENKTFYLLLFQGDRVKTNDR